MKILIVEDETELAKDMVKYLTHELFLCEWALDYQTAIEKIGVYEYDCILLDLMLPDGDGLAILAELKKQNKQDGVIILIKLKSSITPRQNTTPTAMAGSSILSSKKKSSRASMES